MFSHYFARRCSQESPTLGAVGSPALGLLASRPRSRPSSLSPPLPPFLSPLFLPHSPFFRPPSPPRPPRGGGKPRRGREGLVSIFCAAAAGACGGQAASGETPARQSHGWPDAGPWTPQKAAVAVTARPGEALPGRAGGRRGRRRRGRPDPGALARFVVGLRQGRQWEAPVLRPVPAQTPAEEAARVHLGRRGHH